MNRRLMINGKYSGTDILTSRIKCGECGGSYGAKVWHSNNKYRKIMEQLMKQKIKYEKEKLYYTLSKLNTLSPLKVLERGYAIVLKEDNVVLTVNELKTGDKIKIKMKDGSKNAIIE